MHLKNIIYGLIIGIGFIIPGVSGGVLATILGIYDDAINRLNNFKKNIKDNLLYLGNLFIGLVLGIILFSKIILYFFNNNIYSISYIFIGLILGSIPYLIKDVKYKCNQNINLVVFIITFIIGVLLFLVEKNITREGITIIKVNNTRRVLSQISINYFNNPSSKLTTIAITGTKGKTTTSFMIKNILDRLPLIN